MYDVGTRVIVMSRGRISVGDIVGVHGDASRPGYDVQFGEFRTVTYDTRSVIRYTASRFDALNNALDAIFAGFQSEDGVLKKPARN
ncbi:MAG: hypothetical protein LC793_20250 [Thermomicrobia bacterium]|nr:hypothetical protein [Thermomicrobia bacterium]